MSALLARFAPLQLMKYLSVGAFNTVLSLSIIYTMKWLAGWGDVPANMLGYAVGIAVGFVLNGKWTFSHDALKLPHLVGYLSVAGIAYVLNLATVKGLIVLLGVPGDFAQLAGVPVYTLSSYVLNRHFVFSGNRQ